jgi:membrane protein DedA with SNARE-associated domain
MNLDHLPAFLSPFLAYGLLGAAIIAALEKLIPVVPAIALYLSFGLLFQGHLPAIAMLIAATTVGSTIGSLFWYALARLASHDGFFRGFLEPVKAHAAGLPIAFQTCAHNIASPAAVQLVPVARAYAGLLYGAAGMNIVKFSVSTFAGAFAWNATLISAGWIIHSFAA